MNIVCVHGSGSCREAWHYQLEAFDNVHAINLPGHPDGELIPTIDGMVEWLHSYITDAGLAPAVLFGHSLGGALVMSYAVAHPEDVTALVLVGTGAKLKVMPEMLAQLAKDIEQGAPWDPYVGYDLIEREVADVLAKRRQENGLKARLNDLSACNEFDIRGALATIDKPTLAVCGTDDVMTPPKYTEFLAGHLPNCSYHIISGGTHQVHLEKPDEVNGHIRTFLDSL